MSGYDELELRHAEGDPRELLSLAQKYTREGAEELAAKAWAMHFHLTRAPDSAIALAAIAQKMGDWPQVVQYLLPLIDADHPQLPALLIRVVEAYVNAGAPGRAAALVRKHWQQVAHVYSVAIRIASLIAKGGLNEQASMLMRRANTPAFIDDDRVARLMLSEAMLHYRAKYWESFVNLTQKLIDKEFQPALAQAHLLAQGYCELGQLDQAAKLVSSPGSVILETPGVAEKILLLLARNGAHPEAVACLLALTRVRTTERVDPAAFQAIDLIGRELPQALRPLAAADESARPWHMALAIWANVRVKTFSRAFSLAARLEFVAPELAAAEPIASLGLAVPTPEWRVIHAGVAERRRSLSQLKAQNIAVLLATPLDPRQLPAFLPRFNDVYVVFQGVDTNGAKEAALYLRERNAGLTIEATDILKDYTDLYDRSIIDLSDASVTLAADIAEKITDALPPRLRPVAALDPEGFALGLEDRMFASIRRMTAFRRLCVSKSIGRVVVLVDDIAKHDSMIELAEAIVGPANVLVACVSSETGAYTRFDGARRVRRALIDDDADWSKGIRIGLNAREHDATTEEWEAEARRLASVLPQGESHFAILSVGHRVFGPLTAAMTPALAAHNSIVSFIVAAGADDAPNLTAGGWPTDPSRHSVAEVTVTLKRADWLTVEIPHILIAQILATTIARRPGRAEELRLLPTGLTIEAISQSAQAFLTQDYARLQAWHAFFRTFMRATTLTGALLLPSRNPFIRLSSILMQGDRVQTFEIQSVYLTRKARYRRPVVDWFFAIDTYSKDDILVGHLGFAAERCFVAGSLRFDQIARQIRALPDYTRSQKRHSPTLQRRAAALMVVTQPVEVKYNLTMIQWTLEAARRLDFGCDIVIKMHPAEPISDADLYQAEIDKAKSSARTQISKEDDPYLLSLQADIVITQSSNLGIEAAVLGRDVVVVDLMDPEIYIPNVEYNRMGIATIVHDADEFIRVIVDLARAGPVRNNLHDSRRCYQLANPILFEGGSLEFITKTIEEKLSAC